MNYFDDLPIDIIYYICNNFLRIRSLILFSRANKFTNSITKKIIEKVYLNLINNANKNPRATIFARPFYPKNIYQKIMILERNLYEDLQQFPILKFNKVIGYIIRRDEGLNYTWPHRYWDILTSIYMDLNLYDKLYSYLNNFMDDCRVDLLGSTGSNNKDLIISFGGFQTKEYMENELRYLAHILNQFNIPILDMALQYDQEYLESILPTV